MLTVFPKENLGQHFLHDEKIAKKLIHLLTFKGYSSVIELGPGIGLITQYIMYRTNDIFVIELDTEYVKFINRVFPILKKRIIKMNLLQVNTILSSFALIGNFPYNITSNILFYFLKNRNCITEGIGMFQKEVADRIVSTYGNKTYGILSVLIQAFYEVKYLFTIPNIFFSPHPKVKSAVISFHRKSGFVKKLNESILFKIVKVSFNHRRKKLRNTLKSLNLSESFYKKPILDKRAEQLSVQQFIHLSYQAV